MKKSHEEWLYNYVTAPIAHGTGEGARAESRHPAPAFVITAVGP